VSPLTLASSRGKAVYWTVFTLVVLAFVIAFLFPVYWMITTSSLDGWSLPLPREITLVARPEAVFAASAGGAATSGGPDATHQARPGSGQRLVQVRPAGVRHAPDLLAGRRVHHRQRLALGGRLPFTVDEQLRVDVSHGGPRVLAKERLRW